MPLLIPASYRKQPGKWQAPDWFRTRLHDIDPALDILFNINRQRWIIFRTVEGTQTHVKTLENAAGGYQPPDEATLDWLKRADMWGKGKSPGQVAADLAYDEARQRQQITQSIRSDFHDAAMDDKLQIKRAIGSATVFPSTQIPSDHQPSDPDSDTSDASGGTHE